VAPGAAEAEHRRARVPAEDLGDEHRGLVDLIPDHAVVRAPVELERHPRKRELADEVVRAPARVAKRRRQRRAADLLAGELLQPATASQRCEVPVPARHVGRRVECRRAREQVRIARDEKQHLLAAHRAADGVDALRVDVDAVPRCDLRHPREVGDLARRAPRVSAEPTPLARRVDHREAAERRQVAEEARVLSRGQAAAVRRDHERDRPSVVVPREEEVGRTKAAVVRPVPDDADLNRRLRRSCGRRDR
jgi:hypothetical protein